MEEEKEGGQLGRGKENKFNLEKPKNVGEFEQKNRKKHFLWLVIFTHLYFLIIINNLAFLALTSLVIFICVIFPAAAGHTLVTSGHTGEMEQKERKKAAKTEEGRQSGQSWGKIKKLN